MIGFFSSVMTIFSVINGKFTKFDSQSYI
jgi:hypothetical protein